MAKTKRRRNLSQKLGAYLVSFVLVLFSMYLLFDVMKGYVQTLTLRSSLQEVEKQLVDLQNQNQQLLNQKQKLNDPEYVKNYARGQYMLSQKDEQIFRLPKDDE